MAQSSRPVGSQQRSIAGHAADAASIAFAPFASTSLASAALSIASFWSASFSLVAAATLVILTGPAARAQTDLPVDAARLAQGQVVPAYAVRNLISVSQLSAAIGPGEEGLSLDLSGLKELLDGSEVDPSTIWGEVSVGPYPFEAAESDFAYKRFRKARTIQAGQATIPVGGLTRGRANSEDWTDRGTVGIRFELHQAREGADRPLGVYDLFAGFVKNEAGYERLPWILEGPFVCQVDSRHADWLVIALVTDRRTEATVLLSDGRRFESAASDRHEIKITGLDPGRGYTYCVRVGEMTTRRFTLQAAPEPGAGPVRFAYCGDSREGVGGGERNYMGLNFATIQTLAALAWNRKVEFFAMGGDLVNGYTTSKEDFLWQFYGWKQAMTGLWNHRPVYPAMGNHESLLRVFKLDGKGLAVDRWPYATDSAEATFAVAFANPDGGPEPDDPRRPSYTENVFAYQVGLVRMICFNNNYWRAGRADISGGAPEGFIFDDQMRWIEAELRQAEADPTVRYVFLYGQEPVFPCGGHVGDAMWYDGNNAIRAWTFRDGKLHAEEHGVVEVRNRFARAVASASKVAAVFGSDEHSYYRIAIDKDTPVGDPERDDKNGDGRIDWRGSEPASALADLEHATWYVTCGGGGAPYYSEEPTPWVLQRKQAADSRAKYYYSSQENIIFLDADQDRVGMEVINPYGEVIDHIDDLMAIRR